MFLDPISDPFLTHFRPLNWSKLDKTDKAGIQTLTLTQNHLKQVQNRVQNRPFLAFFDPNQYPQKHDFWPLATRVAHVFSQKPTFSNLHILGITQNMVFHISPS